MRKNTILLIACFCLTIFSGLLRGRIEYRWGVPDQLADAAQRIEEIPLKIGNWTSQEKTQLEESAQRMLQCTGNLAGTYVNGSQPDEQVSMIFLVGPAGPLAIHTPDVCYGSNNYSVAEPSRRIKIVDIEGTEHEFAVITFRENRAGNRLLRVYYGWNNEGSWAAPVSPRTAFAGARLLHKLQIATNSVGDQEVDAGEKFLSESLPVSPTACPGTSID